MTFLAWTPEYSAHVDIIDEQHQALFDLLNRLHSSVSEGQEQSALVQILNELVDYTVYHFKTEEELFEKYNYAEREEHINIHNDLTGQAVDLLGELNSGNALISFEVLDFLHTWLTEHTLGLDKDFGKFLADHELL